MTLHRDIGYGDKLPAALIDPLQELISTYLSPNFLVTKASDTSVRVVAGSDTLQVGACVQGKWRYISVTVTASLPSAAAGDYDVFIHTADNSFTPGAPEVDGTDYRFFLKALASGGTPSGAGSERWYRKVAVATFDGTTITSVTMTNGAASVDTIPVGTIVDFAGAVAPASWLLCNGASVLRATYPLLFAAIGVLYGSADGTHFNVPDLSGRVSVGKGANTVVDTLGKNDGVAEASRRGTKHRHTPHTHGADVFRFEVGTLFNTGSGNTSIQPDTPASADGGSGVGADPLDGGAYLVVNKIIKAS